MLYKKFNAFALSALLGTTVLAGCTQPIGTEDASPELRGTITDEMLPVSGVPIKRVHINGSALKAGKRYEFDSGKINGGKFNTALTIDGDVPADVSITGFGGQILVTGNVGTGTVLSTSVGYYYHLGEEYNCGSAKSSQTCNKTVITGIMSPYNQDRQIVVFGKSGEGAKFHTTQLGIYRYRMNPH